MTTFYCDRLEDEVSTKENVAGLLALQEMPGFGEEEVTKVCNAYVLTKFILMKGYLMILICLNTSRQLDCQYIH